MAITYHRVEATDTHLFASIAPDVFDEPVRADRLAAYLRDPNVLMVLAREEGVVVGQCAGVVHRHPDKGSELYVDEVGVAPVAQRRGIARAMMNELFAWARARGCGGAWVATELDNVPARALYTGLGAKGVEMVYFEYEL